MPRPEYKQLNIRTDDYEFFEDFAKKLSAQEGFDLKIVQALKKAAIQYEVKNKLIAPKGA